MELHEESRTKHTHPFVCFLDRTWKLAGCRGGDGIVLSLQKRRLLGSENRP